MRFGLLRSFSNFAYNLSMPPLALVTGAAHRLGKAFALSLARQGYALLLHYHKAESDARQTAEEIQAMGVRVYLARADLTQPDEINSLLSTLDSLLASDAGLPDAEGRLSKFSVLVNSAAAMLVGNPRDLSIEDWDSALDLNLRAPFLLSQAAAKRMTNGGLIVNITDIGAQKAWSRYASYTVSKAALESLTKMLARALAPNIRVNAIAPGLVLQSTVVTPEEWERLIARLPLKRAATLDEVTSALEFLIKNEYITGQTIVVDGGYSLL
jgi:NAD(P)-dependent dehydrogenase (short-subunit alcohol dehydrogenase family)